MINVVVKYQFDWVGKVEHIADFSSLTLIVCNILNMTKIIVSDDDDKE